MPSTWLPQWILIFQRGAVDVLTTFARAIVGSAWCENSHIREHIFVVCHIWCFQRFSDVHLVASNSSFVCTYWWLKCPIFFVICHWCSIICFLAFNNTRVVCQKPVGLVRFLVALESYTFAEAWFIVEVFNDGVYFPVAKGVCHSIFLVSAGLWQEYSVFSDLRFVWKLLWKNAVSGVLNHRLEFVPERPCVGTACSCYLFILVFAMVYWFLSWILKFPF